MRRDLAWVKFQRKFSVRIVVSLLSRNLKSIKRPNKVIQTTVLRMAAAQTFATTKGINIITLANESTSVVWGVRCYWQGGETHPHDSGRRLPPFCTYVCIREETQVKCSFKKISTAVFTSLNLWLPSQWKSLSHMRLFATPWAIQSMVFSRPEYWSG